MLVAYEMTHYILNKRRGLDGYMVVKLDMIKVFFKKYFWQTLLVHIDGYIVYKKL